MAWNDRICDLLDERGWSVADLARAMSGDESVRERLYKYAKRSKAGTKPAPKPRGDMLQRIAAALGVTEIFIEYGPQIPGSEASIGALQPEPRRRIELRGRGEGGADGEIALGADPVGYADMPPSLEGVRGAYGVYVHGDSMVPRYFSGDIVFMNPHRPVKSGDFVLVAIQRGEFDVPRGFVKRLISKSEKEVVLEQYNPPKKLRFTVSSVKSIHYILRPGE